MQIPTTARKRGMYPLVAPSRKNSGDLGGTRGKILVGRQKRASMGQGMTEMCSVRRQQITKTCTHPDFCNSSSAWKELTAIIILCLKHPEASGRDTPKPAVKTSCTLNTLAVCSSKWVHIFYIKDGMKRFLNALGFCLAAGLDCVRETSQSFKRDCVRAAMPLWKINVSLAWVLFPHCLPSAAQ